MPDYAVNTAFNASGNIFKNINKMDKAQKKFGDTATRSFRRASRGGSQFKGMIKSILAADLIKGGTQQLVSGIRSVATEFIQYDQAITSASAKFKDLDTTTAEGQKTLDRLKNTARELGATTEFSATQAAQGLDFLAMAGFTTEQAMVTLPGVVDLATVANVDLARATDIASDSLGAFGLMTDDTTQLQKNFTRVNDVMAKTMTTANTSMEDLFESVKKGGATFTGAGQSMETFSALAGVMANSGLKGSESGTTLRNMMLSLAKATPEAVKVMKKLGVETQDSKGNFRDVIDILGDFKKGLDGMGDAQQTAALSTVFGSRSVTGVNLLLKEGSEKLGVYRDSLLQAGGASEDMAAKMRGSISNQLASMRSAAIEVGFQFVDAFQDKIGPAIQLVTDKIRGINIPAIIESFKSFIDVAMRFRGVLFGMAAGWVAFKVAMTGAAIIKGITGFITFVKVLRSAAAAQGLLNAVMNANPIGLAVTAIAALVGGVILLIDNLDVVKDVLASVAGFFGFGGDVDASISEENRRQDAVADNQFAGATAPNESSLAAQEVNFTGLMTIAGAPDGSTFEGETTGAPAIRVDMAGQN